MAKSTVDPEDAAKRWLAGETLASIGQSYGRSRQRIQQIVAATGATRSLVSRNRPLSRRTIQERFWSKVKTEGACWLWQGSLSGSLGYGQFRGPSGLPEFAHRVSWQLAFGEIPEGLNVLHRCDVPRCVRPDHLYLGTHADNMADAAESRRMRQGYRGRREVVGPELLSVRMSADMLYKIDALAEKEKRSRSEVIRIAIENYFSRVFNRAA